MSLNVPVSPKIQVLITQATQCSFCENPIGTASAIGSAWAIWSELYCKRCLGSLQSRRPYSGIDSCSTCHGRVIRMHKHCMVHVTNLLLEPGYVSFLLRHGRCLVLRRDTRPLPRHDRCLLSRQDECLLPSQDICLKLREDRCLLL